ncbi:hypothetical protein OG304_33565 [Streptomyces sp. NBC_00160]|uniref:hypothetical protein n=1 Tax=Streptomyces TaxID=1883 RepID=UPI00207AED74|nr:MULTISPECIES: hypothetical protein [Streptomyces]MCM9077024.1 hypothetical protein [Streptomyces spororaveus]MCX5308322.1 hypothetical protein [Streptomyces sp. NBC_00160]
MGGLVGQSRGKSVLRACGCAVAGLFLIAGCTADGTPKGGAATGTPGASATAPGTPSGTGGAGAGSSGASTPTAAPGTPVPIPMPALDDSKQPKTAAEARALLGRIIIAEQALGPEFVRSTPFESDPGRWPVLDEACVWQTEGLPDDVLATSTRHFHIPAADGRGRVRINATVTVHHNRGESGWETARAMEEVLRCPDQKLREGEELKGLWGGVFYLGEQMNGWTEDAFTESGKYIGAQDGGPYYYTWSQAQYGPVTVAIAARGTKGITDEELTAFVVQGTSRMMLQAKQELGKAAG